MSRDPLIRRLEVSCSRQRRSLPRHPARPRNSISLYDQPGGYPGREQHGQTVRPSARRRLWHSSPDRLRLAAVVTACSVLILTGLLVQLQSPPVPPLELVEQPATSQPAAQTLPAEPAPPGHRMATEHEQLAARPEGDSSRLWSHIPPASRPRQTAELEDTAAGRLAFRPRADVVADYPPVGPVERQPQTGSPVDQPAAIRETAPRHHPPQPQISGLRRRLLSAEDPDLPRRPIPYENPDPRFGSPVRRDGLVGPIPAVVQPETAILPKDSSKPSTEPAREVPPPDSPEAPEPENADSPADSNPRTSSSLAPVELPQRLTADSIPDSDSLPETIFHVTEIETEDRQEPSAAQEASSRASRLRSVRQAGREQLRQQVLARLKSAREAIARGELDLARAIVQDTAGVKVTYGLFDDRPDLLLSELDQLERRPAASGQTSASPERLPLLTTPGQSLQAVPRPEPVRSTLPQQAGRPATPAQPDSIDLQRMQRESMGTLLQAPVATTTSPTRPVLVQPMAQPLQPATTPPLLTTPFQNTPREAAPSILRNPPAGSRITAPRATDDEASLLSDEDRPPVLSAEPAGSAPPQEFRLSFEFDDAPWSTVLSQLAEATGLKLHMPFPPPGGLTYHNPRKYTQAEVIRILDSILLRRGFRLYEAGNMLVVQPVQTNRQP